MNKLLIGALLTYSFSATSEKIKETHPAIEEENEVISGTIKLEHMGLSIDNFDALDLTKEHPQDDGSITHLIHANNFLGIRTDAIYSYSTPTSRKVIGFEAFTNIQEHHCSAFIEVVSDTVKEKGYTEIQTESNDYGFAVRSVEDNTVLYGECVNGNNGYQFITIMYHTPTREMLTRENNALVTGSYN